MYSVFISHSWHDKALARRIAEAVKVLGGRVWLDEAEIKIGDSLVQKIRAGIDDMDYVVALLSRKSVSSEWVKKELDIAMNHEIAGKRVKVLPILASRCELPGFLQGKLYADMSTKKAFRNSLPMLLDRLGVPSEQIEKIKAGTSPLSLKSKDWVRGLMDVIRTQDESALYKALKTASTYEGEEVLSRPELMEELFQIATRNGAIHLRTRAIEILASIQDSRLAYRFEPFLGDPAVPIVCSAIEALTRTDAKQSAPRVLSLLNSNEDPVIRRECLKYFSKVEMTEKALAVSLIATCEMLLSEHSSDHGLRLMIANALVNQIDSGEEIVSVLLPYLELPGDSSTTAVLNGLHREFYLPAKPRFDLGTAIVRCCDSQNPETASAALNAAFSLADVLGGNTYRKKAWEKLRHCSKWAVQEFLESIADYKGVLLSSPQDIKPTLDLIGLFGEEVDVLLQDMVAEQGNAEGLDFLSKNGYDPQGWAKYHVLYTAYHLERWTTELVELIKRASQNLPEYVLPEGQAVAALTLYKAGALTLSEMLAQFPKQEYAGYRNTFHLEIEKRLKEISGKATAAQRATISKIIRSLRSAQKSKNYE